MNSPSVVRHRERRFRFAVASSFASKVLGAIVQVISLPILLETLGPDRLAAFLALTAFVAWVAPMGLGVLPAMTRQLAAAVARGDGPVERMLVGAGLWFTGLVGLLIILGSVLVATMMDPSRLLGSFPTLPPGELAVALAVGLGLTGAYFFANTAAAVRAGYQETHVSNLLSILANLVTIAGLLLLWRRGDSLVPFVLIIYAPLTILMIADIGRLLAGRPHLRPPRRPRFADIGRGELGSLFRTSGVTWMGQLHGFALMFGSVLVVSHLFGPDSTAAFGSLMRILAIVYAVVGLYAWPLIPAVADAAARRDMAWARRTWIRATSLTLAIALSAGVTIAIFGPQIVHLWLGPDVMVSPAMAVGFGIFFVTFNLNFVSFNLCLSLGATRGLGLAYLAELALVVALALLFMPAGQATGLAIALGLGGSAINLWLLPLRIRNRLRAETRAAGPGGP